MEFSNNQIVMLRNGIYGAVASFNNKPFQIVFKSYTTPTSKYDENFKTKLRKIFERKAIDFHIKRIIMSNRQIFLPVIFV